MKLMGNTFVYLAFLLGAILVTASATDAPSGMTESPAALTSQNPTSQEPTAPSTALTTMVSQKEVTSATQEPALQPASSTETSIFQLTSPTEMPAVSPLPSTASPRVSTSFYATTTTKTDQGPVTLGEDQATANKADICDENSKRLVLICVIIIGVLVIICVLLLLVIVVLASKMSHLKRRQQSKRLPRSNGDFLSESSMWPLGLGTLKRMSIETARTDANTQGPAAERTNAGHEQFEEAGKKLAREISNRQKHRNMPAKSQDETITRVEI